MGVPKFFRWLSERYPKINQRQTFEVQQDTYEEYFKDKNKKDEDDDSFLFHKQNLSNDTTDVLSKCEMIAPEIDRLYIDGNGILHGCSHNNSEGEDDKNITKEEICRNVVYYLDRMITDVVKPKELVYIAIDGVAPRAKLNQQRARRYRGGNNESELEISVYDEIYQKQQQEEEEKKKKGKGGNDDDDDESLIALPKRFGVDRLIGKFMSSDKDSTTTNIDNEKKNEYDNHNEDNDDDDNEFRFHSNSITPGTEFFSFVVRHIEHWIEYKVSTDDRWKDLTIIFSGPNVPGEGEHKIMNFIRNERQQSVNYNTNLRHAIMGQDADLILLGLITHEPNLCIFREQVDFQKFQKKKKRMKELNEEKKKSNKKLLKDKDDNENENDGNEDEDIVDEPSDKAATAVTRSPPSDLDSYLHNSNFEWLHMSILRDYIMFEFETSPCIEDGTDLERTIDDFVFLTFLVGNDFLPHMPALDIADEAFDLLFHTYRYHRYNKWQTTQHLDDGDNNDNKRYNNNNNNNKSNVILMGKKEIQKQKENKELLEPYLTDGKGNILCMNRLEDFVTSLGSRHEENYYENKKEDLPRYHEHIRKQQVGRRTQHALSATDLPDDDILQAKEDLDRAKYREMMMENNNNDVGGGNNNNSYNTKGMTLSKSNYKSKRQQQQQRKKNKSSSSFTPEDDDLESGFFSKMRSLLKYSVGIDDQDNTNKSKSKDKDVFINDQDLKGRYYYDKFQIRPFDYDKHRELRKHYLEALLWNLQYYYQGIFPELSHDDPTKYTKYRASWSWYYPYHYGPMLSDLKDLSELYEEILSKDTSDVKYEPHFRPFEQLLGCLPPSSSKFLPKPYQWLMTSSESPLAEFYPRTFMVDMNGKRWPWEAAVLLPFLDADALLKAVKTHVGDERLVLTKEEQERNSVKQTVVYTRQQRQKGKKKSNEKKSGIMARTNDGDNTAIPPPSMVIPDCFGASFTPQFDCQILSSPPSTKLHESTLLDGVVTPSPGFPTLCTAPIDSLWRRRLGTNVFGSKSRYRTAVLCNSTSISELLLQSVERKPPLMASTNYNANKSSLVYSMAEKLIGTVVYYNYPYLLEGFVTAVSDPYQTYRGKNTPGMSHSKEEMEIWHTTFRQILTGLESGEGYVGSGGWKLSGSNRSNSIAEIMVTLRPLATVFENKAKVYGKYEVKLPLIAVLCSPKIPDPRFHSLPLALERDPYFLSDNEKKIDITARNSDSMSSSSPSNASNVGMASSSSSLRSISSLSFTNYQSNNNNNAHRKHSTFTAIPPPPPPPSCWSLVQQQYQNLPFFIQRARQEKLLRNEKLHHNSILQRQQKLLQNKNTVVNNLILRQQQQQGIMNTATINNNTSLFTRKTAAMNKNKIITTPNYNIRGKLVGITATMVLFLFGGAANASSHWSTNINHPFWGNTQRSRSSSDTSVFEEGGKVGATKPLEFEHGTTTLAFTFKGGIIAAVDSRASIGNFVGSKTVEKVLPINSHMLGTMAGGAADCAYWIRKIQAEAEHYELCNEDFEEMEKDGHRRRMSVTRASKLLSEYLYRNSGAGLSVGTMIMGFNSNSKDGLIYYVDNTGIRLEGKMFSVGSGSTYALAILDDNYKEDMTTEEAITLGIRAIRHATFRDAFSGGYINVFLITPQDGWKRVYREDLATTLASEKGID